MYERVSLGVWKSIFEGWLNPRTGLCLNKLESSQSKGLEVLTILANQLCCFSTVRTAQIPALILKRMHDWEKSQCTLLTCSHPEHCNADR